jgi:hypothetical protein
MVLAVMCERYRCITDRESSQHGPGGAGQSLSCASSRLLRSPVSILLRAGCADLSALMRPGHGVRHGRVLFPVCGCCVRSWLVLRFRQQNKNSAQKRTFLSGGGPRDFSSPNSCPWRQGGFSGESAPGHPPAAVMKRVVAGLECFSSPFSGTGQHSDH